MPFSQASTSRSADPRLFVLYCSTSPPSSATKNRLVASERIMNPFSLPPLMKMRYDCRSIKSRSQLSRTSRRRGCVTSPSMIGMRANRLCVMADPIWLFPLLYGFADKRLNHFRHRPATRFQPLVMIWTETNDRLCLRLWFWTSLAHCSSCYDQKRGGAGREVGTRLLCSTWAHLNPAAPHQSLGVLLSYDSFMVPSILSYDIYTASFILQSAKKCKINRLPIYGDDLPLVLGDDCL